MRNGRTRHSNYQFREFRLSELSLDDKRTEGGNYKRTLSENGFFV